VPTTGPGTSRRARPPDQKRQGRGRARAPRRRTCGSPRATGGQSARELAEAQSQQSTTSRRAGCSSMKAMVSGSGERRPAGPTSRPRVRRRPPPHAPSRWRSASPRPGGTVRKWRQVLDIGRGPQIGRGRMEMEAVASGAMATDWEPTGRPGRGKRRRNSTMRSDGQPEPARELHVGVALAASIPDVRRYDEEARLPGARIECSPWQVVQTGAAAMPRATAWPCMLAWYGRPVAMAMPQRSGTALMELGGGGALDFMSAAMTDGAIRSGALPFFEAWPCTLRGTARRISAWHWSRPGWKAAVAESPRACRDRRRSQGGVRGNGQFLA